MYELKKIGKVLTSKSVGTGPCSYKKRIYWASVSQRLRNTDLRRYPNTYYRGHCPKIYQGLHLWYLLRDSILTRIMGVPFSDLSLDTSSPRCTVVLLSPSRTVHVSCRDCRLSHSFHSSSALRLTTSLSQIHKVHH